MGRIRTRFAPSPTGAMHVGNLRTALYEFLVAKSNGGSFLLRIEDTDRDRFVDGAQEIIFDTLRKVGLKHDEGPDIGGDFGPYIQSQRKDIYLPYAQKLVNSGKAYYCFCDKERLDSLKEGNAFEGYDRHCRNLSYDAVQDKLNNGDAYVIRQKIPLDGSTSFYDTVFGEITIENKEIEDQILIKADGYPTYNFANVVDDFLMGITHVVRGCEYLTSTPKYNLLYSAFGWDIPTYVHLPLIMGRNDDGSISKLSKRHGSTSFEGLIKDGYLAQAIINYIALLGWSPKGTEEIFSLDELVEFFAIDGISKSPAVFDYNKLLWMNGEYIKNMTDEQFMDNAMPYFKQIFGDSEKPWNILIDILKPRIGKFNEIPTLISFLKEIPDYPVDYFVNKKSKTNLENAPVMLKETINTLEDLQQWNMDNIHGSLISLASNLGVKNGTLLWPVRIASAGQMVTPGGALEILTFLGREEALFRLNVGLAKLNG